MLNAFLSEMSWAGYILAFGLVFVGAALQVATGIGLGLIAGPSLLLLLDGPSAVMTAICLNLALTACLLPAEIRDVAPRVLAVLSTWAAFGVAVGTGLMVLASATTLKIAGGIVVLLAVAQLRFLSPERATDEGASRWTERVGGTASGVMTGALAVPGPAALWTMLWIGLDPACARATLRAYFMIAYTVALAIHLVIAERTGDSFSVALALLPAVGLGIAAGLFCRKALSAGQLRAVLEAVLLVMGISLFCRGVWDAVQPLA